MMFRNKNRFAFFFTVLSVAGFAMQSDARPNVNTNSSNNGGGLRTTASACQPATATIDLDINNVRARLMTGGDMWWNQGQGVAAYEVPKGGGASSLFAGSCWIGGIDAQGQLKVAAQTYRQDGNDYWPGPLDDQAAITQTTCSDWDQFWKINASDITAFRQLVKQGSAADALNDPTYLVIKTWPAVGNPNALGVSGGPLDLIVGHQYAPFVDVNDNHIYDPQNGDYPQINGDQFIWWVFNDKGNVKLQSQTQGIGIEVQASAFAYSTKDQLNDATFYNYRLVNRGNIRLDSTFIATWSDADLGWYLDDYIGCDTGRSLGILYNGETVDGPNGQAGTPGTYGYNVPMIGVDFFKGPIKNYDSAGQHLTKRLGMTVFDYFNNDVSSIGNPSNGTEIYRYMTGTNRRGVHFSDDFNGPGIPSVGYGSGPKTNFVFFGDPGVRSEWSECTCLNPPADKRFIHSSGPFVLQPGAANDITIGVPWVANAGGCPSTSFKKLRIADDLAQALFDNNFKTIEGPNAPRLVVREMDRKLVFYIVNDSLSNNFQEKYGYDTSAAYRVPCVKAKALGAKDSLYKFEGYRVFQLKTALTQASQIYDQYGQVDNTVASEVFSCDIKNGVTKIINYDKDLAVSDTTFKGVVKVTGKDSGITHSFEISLDQFANGTDKQVVNYHSYYFVAVAYAYNNFAPFDPLHLESTQDVAYLESAHGAGGLPISIVTAMPNPANGDMGTVLNADFGSGVTIHKIEGVGNGGNALQLSDESEASAMTAPTYHSVYPTYTSGAGPVNIKVIDPVSVPAADWELYIQGPQRTNVDSIKGIIDSLGSWKLVNITSHDTIYSETNIKLVNEQILEKYGLSVTINQRKRPGDDMVNNNNGYISSDITFADQSQPWLAGISDAAGTSVFNWLRSGSNSQLGSTGGCDYNDIVFDSLSYFQNMLSNYTTTKSTWGPYGLANRNQSSACGFGVGYTSSTGDGLKTLQSVDIVLTSDVTKWTRCPVLEMNDDSSISQGHALKLALRKHPSWNMQFNADGSVKYATTSDIDPVTNKPDSGMSWFPGYAINQETGERLNLAFGEDSWLKSDNGADMLWNPTSNTLNQFDNLPIFGGKHYVYVLNTKYDAGHSLDSLLCTKNYNLFSVSSVYKRFIWVGVPTLSSGFSLKPLKDGLIPTETRIRMRVARPYGKYITTDSSYSSNLKNGGFPLYSFTTKDIAPTALTDKSNMYYDDKDALLKRIHAVPNPYYGYTPYEASALDTRVRIINLPAKATLDIYSLDGTLIRSLLKDNANVSYIDWDLRNSKGLPIASGMYLIHVKAEGIGETVLKFFGSFRPLNITLY